MKRIKRILSTLGLEANQKKKQRLFGFIACAFVLIAFGFKFWKTEEFHWPLLISGMVILFVSIFLPILLKYPLMIWLCVGKILGEISSRIILAVLYLLIAFPISLFKKKQPVSGWQKKKVEENDYEKMY